jgi:hypothetical protein
VVLEAIASLVVTHGQAARAARLLAAAASLRERLGTPLPPIERPEFERSVAAARTALGEPAFAAAWSAGQAMPVEQAVCVALEEGDVSRAGGNDS